MARGQAQAAANNLATTNAIGSQYNTQAGTDLSKANALQSDLIPGYTSLMDTGYLSPEEENAATTSEMGAATAPFSSAEFQAKNNAAATRNPAGLASQEDQLAEEEGQTAGTAASNLQAQKMQNQEAGMYGLSEQEQADAALRGQDITAQDAMYGLGPGTLNARAASSGPQWGFGVGPISAKG
jgi:hypothetical protein